ncbi:MAG: efflux RND transporter periplasmic adaptor subunit [Bdellovibrionota bacterium]|nr:efflux RND transporter periplasmic adaptor subunit [Bdellovibrionota bacterium]
MKTIILLAFFSTVAAFGASDIPRVKTSIVEIKTVDNVLNYPVLIKSKVDSHIKSDASLIVLKHLVDLGQRVEKGTPLMELRHPDMTMQYQNRILKAPVSGVIAGIHTEVGNYVAQGATLISINDPEQIYGVVEIPAVDYRKLKVGLSAQLSFEQLNKSAVNAKVSGIGSMVDSSLGTIPLHLEIDEKLLPGSIGLAAISLKKEQLILVDEKVLYFSGDDVFLPLLEDEKVKKVKISLGKRHKNQIEIKEGVTEGQIYISDSPKFLRDGQKVELEGNKDAPKTL